MNTSRKGQSFIIGALVFSLLVTLVFLSTGPSIVSPDATTQGFFSQTLEESSNAFNNALLENQSATHVRQRMQSYDRFVERQAVSRRIEYSSYSLVVIPERGEASFLNYFPAALDVSLRLDGDWTNRTVASGQGFTTTTTPGKISVYLEIPERDEEYRMDAGTPRLVKHSIMESSGEKWENTLVG